MLRIIFLVMMIFFYSTPVFTQTWVDDLLAALRLAQLPAEQAYPVVGDLAEPASLRPCCAFGMDLGTEFLQIPLPWYCIDNVVSATTLGEHFYNGDTFGVAGAILGLSGERNGLIYTRRGGFLDSAHIRDTADNTLFLFSQIYPHLGKEMTLSLSPELASRRIKPAPVWTVADFSTFSLYAEQQDSEQK